MKIRHFTRYIREFKYNGNINMEILFWKQCIILNPYNRLTLLFGFITITTQYKPDIQV